MSKQKQVHTAQQMPSNEALQLSGIRELTGEELFKVNGGRNVEEAGPVCGSKPDTSDDSPSSGSTSSGGSSSGSSGDSSSGNSSTSSGDSSGNSGSTSGSSDSSSGGASSHDSSDSSYSGSPNENEETSPTQSGNIPHTYWNPPSDNNSSSNDNSSNSSSGSSSDNDSSSSDSSSGSSSSDSSDDDFSSSSYDDYSGSGSSSDSSGNSYVPPAENQEPSAPSPIEETQNVQENTGVTSSLPQKPVQAENNKINMNPIFPKDIFNKPRKNLAPLRGIAPEYRPLWPTESRRITSEFGSLHKKGIDVGALKQGKRGDLIKASMGGTVTVARVPDWSGSKSTYVVVHGDDGKEYRYAHLDIYPGIFEGSRVNQGELIGFMSDNGAPGQVHLHFEIREAGKPINPTTILP